MIEITSQQQLALLFPKSNKVMEKLLENATPEQLKTLSEAKDLKAVLSQLMSDTLDVSKSNKIILDILKNSNIFKELGSFPQELKSLLELLQTESKNGSNSKLDKILQTLKLSLLDFKQIDNTSLKDFIKNSGVFLESKFIQDKNPKAELQNALVQLKSTLGQSDQKGIADIIKNIDSLLNNKTIFDKHSDVKVFESIKKELSALLSNIKEAIKGADPLYSKEVQTLISKLENFSQTPVHNRVETFSLSTLKNLVHELLDEMRISAKSESKALASQLSDIQSKLSSIQKENMTLPLLKTLSSTLKNLDITSLSKLDNKELQALIAESKTLSQMKFEDIEVLKTDDLKTFFTAITDKIAPFNTQGTKSIFDIIEKILSSLKQPQQGFEDLKVPKDIKNWIANFEKEMAKADVLFSKPLQAQLDKIAHFASPSHLLDNKLLQESLQKDIKALLLGLEKELGTSSTVNTTELLKSVDKLLLQVDYFQLMSHLSNASYLYLPYHWDGLDNGQFSFKNRKDGSCYCEIDLELKEYGKLNMILQLFEDNQLNMMIYTQKKELKAIFKENIKELRASLTAVDIMPRNIHLFELDENSERPNPYGNGAKLDELGFEVKG